MKTTRRIAVTLSVAIVAAALSASAGAVPEPFGDSGGLLDVALADALDIGRVAPPPPGVGLLMRAHFPEESPLEVDGRRVHALAVDIRPDGTVMARSAEEGSGSTTGVAGKCQDPTFLPMGPTWAPRDMPIKWTFNNRTLPPRVVQFRTVRALRRAHWAWPKLLSPCRAADNSFSFRFLGFNLDRLAYDGNNQVAFGKLGSRALAVSYTYYVRSRIVEVDPRLNRFDYPWTNRFDRPNRYLVGNVAIHEVGHQLGLDDLGDPHRYQTMFGRISKGEIRKLRLGKGDLRGAATVSP